VCGLKQPECLPGDRGRGINHLHPFTDDRLDQRYDKRKVRARQDHRIDAPAQHGRERPLENATGFRASEVPGLDLLDEARAGILQHGDASGETFDNGGIQRALEGRRRGEHADDARMRPSAAGLTAGSMPTNGASANVARKCESAAADAELQATMMSLASLSRRKRTMPSEKRRTCSSVRGPYGT